MQFKPVRSEKSLKEAASGCYTFAVDKLASKTDIKRGVERMFGVNVTAVQTALLPGKSYRTGRRNLRASRSDWKKARVTVKSGQKIDLFASG